MALHPVPVSLADRARRVEVEYRLISAGITPDIARAWLRGWEAEADRQRIERDDGYREAGLRWIRERRPRPK
jgi:hypothetical protein